MKSQIKKIVLFLAIIVNIGVLFVNIYNSIVYDPNWGTHIPSSIETARNYFTTKSPSNLFKIFGIVIHILGINSVIRFWKNDKQIRLYNISALFLILIIDLLTFAYFLPRNDIMFDLNSTADIQTLTTAWREWANMNWVRTFITFGIVMLYSLSLNKLYKLRQV
ncbi:anthrone oxygenase family protein [Leeuwenhoekiella polynyae]|uniref:DUF1772 domain-containing protein n=1 Tax=Leeuwenhoekiella polynyae TaxID=1550906 RepID=A0A4Q0P5L2_9FLAO|nr:anthrone oxygenase family protein [Leeuwenhoekiella polynyae]RXG21721.1 hypothetical protein DSM02_1966 [Leeuwenhoekiella polynyae]